MPVEFLTLAGIQARYYKTTTFMHSKVIIRDGEEASISSINYSYTSFMKNREGGLIFSGDDIGPFMDFWQNVFEVDFNRADPWPLYQKYTSKQLKVIQDPSKLPVVVPPPRQFPGQYIPKEITVNTNKIDLAATCSPDSAYSYLMSLLKGSDRPVKGFQLEIYQITDSDLAQAIIALHQSGVQVELLVSDNIFSTPDYEKAKQQYTLINNAGIKIQKTRAHLYSYTHIKTFIIWHDIEHSEATLGLSTGNFSPSDYPNQDYFPPYGQTGWVDSNRDFNVYLHSTSWDPGWKIIDNFNSTFWGDYAIGSQWYP